MGDRAMAEIRTDGGSLYVYIHWGGYSLPDNAKGAVKAAEGRWSDTPYATRIIVDQLTKEGRDLTMGYGLMLKPSAEDEYNSDKPSVIIDLVAQKLTVIRSGKEETTNFQDLG